MGTETYCFRTKRERVSKNVTDAVSHKFYKDDYLDCFNNLPKAVSTILSVSSLLKNVGFLVTKWMSNSIGILNTLPKDDISPKVIKTLI